LYSISPLSAGEVAVPAGRFPEDAISIQTPPKRRRCESRAGIAELLRHSSIKVTKDVYTQAVIAAKRKAQSKVVQMIIPKEVSEAVRQRTGWISEASSS
jgi:hypothetical protein